MAARPSILFTGVLLVACTGASAQTPRPAPAPPGNRIVAHDGDTIDVENDARVKIVRRREANVRVVFNRAERWLILLVDYVANGGPDGRVDTVYNFTGLSADWPMEERWEGRATIEDYSGGGDGGPSATGFAGPQGLVQFLAPHLDTFRDPDAVAVLSFSGAGRGTTPGIGFDEAERSQVDQTRRNAARKAPDRSGVGPSTTLEFTSRIEGVRPGEAPLRVGGNVRPPAKIVDVPPVMPEQAARAGVRGVVILEITIDTDGTVSDARVLRSIPLLDQAALDAARQWRFTPTTLDGRPVPIIMTATVSFP